MAPAMGLDGLFFNTRRLIYHSQCHRHHQDATPLKEIRIDARRHLFFFIEVCGRCRRERVEHWRSVTENWLVGASESGTTSRQCTDSVPVMSGEWSGLSCQLTQTSAAHLTCITSSPPLYSSLVTSSLLIRFSSSHTLSPPSHTHHASLLPLSPFLASPFSAMVNTRTVVATSSDESALDSPGAFPPSSSSSPSMSTSTELLLAG
jgi:hypothetical protein